MKEDDLLVEMKNLHVILRESITLLGICKVYITLSDDYPGKSGILNRLNAFDNKLTTVLTTKEKT